MSDYFEEMGWTPLGDGEAPNHLLHMARLLRDSGLWELLDQDARLPPPASKEALNALEDIKISSSESKQCCPVCIKEFEMGNLVKTLPCRHTFHRDCIIPWLEKVRNGE